MTRNIAVDYLCKFIPEEVPIFIDVSGIWVHVEVCCC